MVKHIVMWNFSTSLAADDKRDAAKTIKRSLEQLKEKIPGIISLEVVIDGLAGSDREIALISEFQSEEALKAYQTHPEHVKAGVFVKTVCRDRICFDFNIV